MQKKLPTHTKLPEKMPASLRKEIQNRENLSEKEKTKHESIFEKNYNKPIRKETL
jgi:hypothetical protein